MCLIVVTVVAGHGCCQVLAVNWRPPPSHSRNGIISGYKIRYKPRGERTEELSIVTDGNSRSHEITGKHPTYSFGICLIPDPLMSYNYAVVTVRIIHSFVVVVCRYISDNGIHVLMICQL